MAGDRLGHVGVALSAFRLESADPAEFRRDITNLVQTSLMDPIAAMDGEAPLAGLPTATSELRFEDEPEKNVLVFRATHYSDTKVQPVRVFFEQAIDAYTDFDPPEPAKVRRGIGFQEIHRFKVIMDFNRREILGFHKKEIVRQRTVWIRRRLDSPSVRRGGDVLPHGLHAPWADD